MSLVSCAVNRWDRGIRYGRLFPRHCEAYICEHPFDFTGRMKRRISVFAYGAQNKFRIIKV